MKRKKKMMLGRFIGTILSILIIGIFAYGFGYLFLKSGELFGESGKIIFFFIAGTLIIFYRMNYGGLKI